MPKATITTPAGTKITIEGSTEEVQELVLRLETKSARRPSKSTAFETGRVTTQKAIKDYILELRDAGLFGKPQGLADIKSALQAEGHIVPITTLSGVMLGLVKSRALRRFQEERAWKYVER